MEYSQVHSYLASASKQPMPILFLRIYVSKIDNQARRPLGLTAIATRKINHHEDQAVLAQFAL